MKEELSLLFIQSQVITVWPLSLIPTFAVPPLIALQVICIAAPGGVETRIRSLLDLLWQEWKHLESQIERCSVRRKALACD
jgi:hypothetical protein